MTVPGLNLNAAKKRQCNMLQRSPRSDRNEDVFSADLAMHREEAIEREMLSCCYCDAPLEPIMLETDANTGEQRLLWACRNMKKQKCFFPMGLPHKIFFLKRSAIQKEDGIIPKPEIRRLPKKYWGLYPTVFADELQSRSRASSARAETSMSNHTTDYSACPTNSPTTSGSSVSSDNAAVDQLLKMGPETSVWGDSVSRSKTGRIVSSHSSGASGSGGTHRSAETDSVSNFSSSDASEENAGSSLAKLICDQLHYTGVDISRLEDEELVSRMAGVVKKLHREKLPRTRCPGNFTLAEYRASLDYLFNLDVTPIKRKLSVLSTDLTRAVAVMRSRCDIDTMLDAMGGSTPSTVPPPKRSRIAHSKQELRKRVEDILKNLAERGNETEEPTSTSAETTNDGEDPAGDQEWYEGEDGPTTSSPAAPEIDTTLAEEERLNAFVQEKVRNRIASVAAVRHENRLKRMQESFEAMQQTQSQPPVQAPPLHPNVPVSSEHFHEMDGPLSFDSPYAEHLVEHGSTLGFPHDDLIHQPNSSAVQDPSISETTLHNNHSLNSELDLHSSVGDDEFNALFGDYNFV